MRVVAGEFRGRKLKAPAGRTTRPMTDRVKETLFNILGARWSSPGRLPPFPALDLFAGSGGLGIEALSRGAASCVFIESDRASLATLRENLRTLGLERVSRTISCNIWTARLPAARASPSSAEEMTRTPAAGEGATPPPDYESRQPMSGEPQAFSVADGYGLVFVDPPYRDARDPHRPLALLERLAPLLRPDGVICFRQERGASLPVDQLHNLMVADERTIGTMRLWLLGRDVSLPQRTADPS